MRGRISALTCVALGLLLWAQTAGATARNVNPDGVCGGSVPCYSTIHAAVSAADPGDQILLQAAVHFVGAPVEIDKSLQILGPQLGITPLPSLFTDRVPGGPLEAVVEGGHIIFRILADDVLIDGVEFRGGSGDLIESVVATPTSGTIIRHCIIHASGDEGIQLRATTNAKIECNYVFDTGGDGINLCCGSVDGMIRYNEVADVHSNDAAIYVYGATNTTIEGNLVYGTTQNDCIKLGSKNGADAGGTGGNILLNEIHDSAQDGIAVYMSNTQVRCNNVYNCVGENGAIYLAFAIGNVTIRSNKIHDNNLNPAKWGDPAGVLVGTDVNAATVTILANTIVGNLPNGVTNKAVPLLKAEDNWWGHAFGPSGAGVGMGDAVSTNVDFSPWWGYEHVLNCPTMSPCGIGPTPNYKRTWGQIKSIYR